MASTIAEQLGKAIERGLLKEFPTDVMASHLLCLMEAEFIEHMVHRSAPPLAADEVAAAVSRALDVFLAFYGE